MPTVLLALLVFSAMPNTQQWTQWQEFSSVEGRFSASMPVQPRSRALRTETATGVVFTQMVSATDEELNEFMVAWTEYRQDKVDQRANEKTYDKVRDGLMTANGGGRVLSESTTALDGYPGRFVRFETSDGRTVTARFGFIKNRFYQVMAEIKRQNTDAGERFVNSFKLLPGTLL
jgi:hypothetical protein